ncbi:MAG: nitrilase-related carbon-nitrogen hydrolase [Vulcanimicrobiota bacterium]
MKLTVTLAQISVTRSQPEKNLEKAEALTAEAARRGSQLIVFPEMWTTGFEWEYLKRAKEEHRRSAEQLAAMARRHRIWMAGSIAMPDEEGKVANTQILFDDRGEKAAIYSKTHLFSLFHEDQHLTAGTHLTVADAPWGMTGLSICYDIRFPELYRTYALKGVKLVLSPMAFPYPRLEHWKILVRARAIENQLFFVGVNQVGSEDMGSTDHVTYFGTSCIIDPWGKTVVEAGENDEMLLTATIETDYVDEVRQKMRVLPDRRPDLYELG